jgi:hypothetical protein
MRISKIITTVLLAALCLPLSAQSEAGLLVGAEVEKRVNKKLSIGIEAEMRTRNNLKTMDRWKFGIGAEYKLSHWDRYLGMMTAMTQVPVPTTVVFYLYFLHRRQKYELFLRRQNLSPLIY